jgi:chromosome segregation ATPase
LLQDGKDSDLKAVKDAQDEAEITLTKAKKEKETEVNSLKEAKETVDKKVEALEKTLAKAKDDLEAKTKELEDVAKGSNVRGALKVELEKAESELEAAIAEKRTLRASLRDKDEEIDSMNTSKDAMQREFEKLEKKLEKLQTEKEELAAQIEKLKAEGSSKGSGDAKEVEDIRSQLATSKTALETETKAKAALQSQLLELYPEVKKDKDTILKLESDLKKAAEGAGSAVVASQLADMTAKFKGMVEKAKTYQDALKFMKDKSDADVAAKNAEITRLRTQLAPFLPPSEKEKNGMSVEELVKSGMSIDDLLKS